MPVLCSEGEGNDETNKEICDGLSLSTESLRNSMSEQDVKDVLFEAGYSINEIKEIVAANADKNGLEDSLNSSFSVNSIDSDTSESVDVSAFDVLKEIRVRNVDKIVIGTLNINSLAPKRPPHRVA